MQENAMAAGTQPNIVLIMSDQHNANAMGCAGNPVVRTPNLDALAGQGTRFTNVYCPYPLCAPSRMGFMAASYPSEVGVFDNGGILSSQTPTFAHGLGASGYETVLCGRMHFVGPDPFHGFEKRIHGDCGGRALSTEILGSGNHRTNGQTKYAVEVSGYGETGYQRFDRSVTDTACDYISDWTGKGPSRLPRGRPDAAPQPPHLFQNPVRPLYGTDSPPGTRIPRLSGRPPPRNAELAGAPGRGRIDARTEPAGPGRLLRPRHGTRSKRRQNRGCGPTLAGSRTDRHRLLLRPRRYGLRTRHVVEEQFLRRLRPCPPHRFLAAAPAPGKRKHSCREPHRPGTHGPGTGRCAASTRCTGEELRRFFEGGRDNSRLAPRGLLRVHRPPWRSARLHGPPRPVEAELLSRIPILPAFQYGRGSRREARPGGRSGLPENRSRLSGQNSRAVVGRAHLAKRRKTKPGARPDPAMRIRPHTPSGCALRRF